MKIEINKGMDQDRNYACHCSKRYSPGLSTGAVYFSATGLKEAEQHPAKQGENDGIEL